MTPPTTTPKISTNHHTTTTTTNKIPVIVWIFWGVTLAAIGIIFQSFGTTTILSQTDNNQEQSNFSNFPSKKQTTRIQLINNNNNDTNKDTAKTTTTTSPPPPQQIIRLAKQPDEEEGTERDATVVKTTTTTTTAPLPPPPPSSSSSSISSSSFASTLEKMQISKERLATQVPKWALEYFEWHRQQLALMDETNWMYYNNNHNDHTASDATNNNNNNNTLDDSSYYSLDVDGNGKTMEYFSNFRYLILRCTFGQDGKCGGFSDRMKPFPYFLRLAYDTQRIFFIRWDRPYPLEEFLIPTEHFNWTVPSYINDYVKVEVDVDNDDVAAESTMILSNNTTTDGNDDKKKKKNKQQTKPKKTPKYYFFGASVKTLESASPKQKFRIVEGRLQLHDGGWSVYNTLVKKDFETKQQQQQQHPQTYRDVYHGLFRALFQPSPPIAKIVINKLQKYGLLPGQYVGCHIRAFYGIDASLVSNITQYNLAVNAVKCALELLVVNNDDENNDENDNGGGRHNKTATIGQNEHNKNDYDNDDTPIYIASDSKLAMQMAIDYGRRQWNRTIVANLEDDDDDGDVDKHPLHLDFGSRENIDNYHHPPSDYYDTFVDLLMMGNAKRMTMGIGGFGKYALLLTFEPNDAIEHHKRTCQGKKKKEEEKM